MRVDDISDEDMRDLLSSKDVGSGRARLKRLLAKADDLPWDAASNRNYEPVEALAAKIYAHFSYDEPGEKPPWIPGGNSLKQDLARMDAREKLRSDSHVPV